MPKFTVCALLYGDFPHLAERCLKPLLPLVDHGLIDLRVGCNQISPQTERYLTLALVGRVDRIEVVRSEENILKYPMMRLLFGIEGRLPRIETPWVMWFDDDSYIKDPDPAGWLDRVEEKMHGADMIGSLYRDRKSVV